MKLSNEGLQAGAFSKAVEAAAFANAAATPVSSCRSC